MFDKPVVAGTRTIVEHILRCLAAGERPEDIVADYPTLTLGDIRAARETGRPVLMGPAYCNY